MHTQFHSYKGTQVAYSVKGAGPCVVLIHGFCESAEMWKDYVPVLSKTNTVLTFDIPGHGQTPMVAGELTHMEVIADILKALLDVLNIENVVLVGHSMGGYVSLAFAEKNPEKVNGMFLFHSTAYADTDEKKQDRARAVEVVKQNKKAYVQALIPGIFDQSKVEEYREEIAWLREIGNQASAEGIVGALLGMSARPDRTQVLANADFPVHFLFGKADNILPLAKHINLISLPRISQATVLEDVGHAGFVEKEMLSLSAIRQFIGFLQD